MWIITGLEQSSESLCQTLIRYSTRPWTASSVLENFQMEVWMKPKERVRGQVLVNRKPFCQNETHSLARWFQERLERTKITPIMAWLMSQPLTSGLNIRMCGVIRSSKTGIERSDSLGSTWIPNKKTFEPTVFASSPPPKRPRLIVWTRIVFVHRTT